ncbi:hypothetical protein DFP74_2541 [Nocardiopsis sp. Huas11]|nr:hypothetical protein DFP74_2541 [Nocardiopsis sp. Huas11]
MRLRHRPADRNRITAGRRPRAEEARTYIRSLALPVALSSVVMVSACGGGGEEETGGPGSEAAAELHDAQVLSLHDATLMPEGSESGVYSELVTVQYSEEVRASTELDKPECVDAANRWGDLDGVQDAPASIAAYEWSEGSLSHMLVRLDPSVAEEAMSTEPPESCASYSATYEDGSSSDYGVSELDLPAFADESRAYAIEVSSADEHNNMYSVMYRNGDLLGTTSILGAGGLEDYEDMLVEFTEAAIERQGQMLGD